MGVVRNLRQVAADDAGVDIAFRADVHAGLSQQPKAIPARWFYDATGSALFEDITALPEYYPTRSETDMLTRHSADIAAAIGPGRAVVELGSGSSTKTPLLLDAIAPAAYVPVDISGDFLRGSAEALAIRFPGLPIYPVEADFTQRVTMPDEIADLPKLGFFPGSTIGNMVARTAIDLLRNWRCALGEASLLLIGIDRIKDVATLELAYDDPAGVTAASTSTCSNGSTASSAATFRSRISPIAPCGTTSTHASKCTSSRRATSSSPSTAAAIRWRRARRFTARTAINTARATRTCCCARAAGRRSRRGMTPIPPLP